MTTPIKKLCYTIKPAIKNYKHIHKLPQLIHKLHTVFTYQYTNNNTPEKLINPTLLSINPIPKHNIPTSNYFIHPKIQQWITTNLTHQMTYPLNNNTTNPNIEIYYNPTIHKNPQIILYNVLLLIYTIGQFISPQQQYYPDKILIYLTPFKKFLNIHKKNSRLTPYNLNSAFITKYNNSNSTLVVFREEEYLRNLTHELVHFYELECKTLNYTTPNNPLYELFGLKPNQELRASEAFTELITIAIHIGCSSIKRTELITNINLECQYSLFQTANYIWKHFHKRTLAEFLNTRHKNLKETTAVFSYIFIKTCLFWNINTYLDTCCDDINRRFISGQEATLLHILANTINDPQFHEIINRYVQRIKTNNKTKKLARHYRMTCLNN